MSDISVSTADHNIFFQCNPGVATYGMTRALTQPPTKIMLLGCGCSTASEATAQVSHLYNLTQVRQKQGQQR